MRKGIQRIVSAAIAVLMCASVTACSNSSKPTSTSSGKLKPVTLKVILYDAKKADSDKVWNQIASDYKDKLNAKFDVEWIAGTDYISKLTVMAASGDSWDLNFDGDWLTYYQMAAKNAYLPLNKLLPKYAPDLYKAYNGTNALAAATYKGDIIALPWTMTMTERPIFMWREDLAKNAGVDIAPDSVKTIQDLDTALGKLKAAMPDKYIIEAAIHNEFEAEYNLDEISHDYVFDLTDSGCKVTPLEQTQAYKEEAEYAYKWQNAGYIWKDVLTDKTDHNLLINQGKLISKVGSHEEANDTRAWTDQGAHFASSEMYPDKVYATRTPLANIVAIPKTSKNPERTLMFLNLVQTDEKLYDLLMYGIEGETYVKNGDSVAYPSGMDSSTSNYMDWGGRWAFWKPQYMLGDATYSKGFWTKEADFVKSSKTNVTSPLDGFQFDVSSLSSQVSQRDQIFGDEDKLLTVGLGGNPDAAVATLISKENAAGTADITKELQKQINAFLASKKK